MEEWGQRYPSVFKKSFGLCSKISVKLELKEGSKPVYMRAQPVAIPFREAADKALERLLANVTL